MLTIEEINQIEHEVKKFPYRQAAAIEALLVVQNGRKYISDDILKEIANLLDMSVEELDGIATFYNNIYRKPVGENVVKICDSISCHIMGYEKLLGTIKEVLKIDLGATSSDNKFTLLPAQCLGCCDKAPSLMINDDLFCDLNKDKIIDLFKSYQDVNYEPK